MADDKPKMTAVEAVCWFLRSHPREAIHVDVISAHISKLLGFKRGTVRTRVPRIIQEGGSYRRVGRGYYMYDPGHTVDMPFRSVETDTLRVMAELGQCTPRQVHDTLLLEDRDYTYSQVCSAIGRIQGHGKVILRRETLYTVIEVLHDTSKG